MKSHRVGPSAFLVPLIFCSSLMRAWTERLVRRTISFPNRTARRATLGFFLEPRFVVGVYADRVGLYVFTWVAVSRISETEAGTRSVELEFVGIPLNVPTQPEAYSVDVTRTSLAAYVRPGLLIRLTSHVNLDLGLTPGFSSWGEPDPRVEPDFTGWNSTKSWYVLGGWVGLVIGIG